MATQIEQVPIGELVLDYNLYPRHSLGSVRVARLTEAARTGVEFPPIRADRKSKRVVDGFGRVTAIGRVLGAEAVIATQFKNYKNEQELWAEAVALNSEHGTPLTPFDIRRITIMSEKLGLSVERLSPLVHVRPELLRKTLAGRTNGDRIPLKRTLAHLDGQKLTPEQIEVNEHASGMPALFHVRQLAMLIEGDALDMEDEALLAELAELAAAISLIVP